MDQPDLFSAAPDPRPARPHLEEALDAVLGPEESEDPATTEDSPASPPEEPAAEPSIDPAAQALLDRLDEEMRLRGYAIRTRKVYVAHAKRLLVEADLDGDLAEELRAHLLRKLEQENISRSYHSQLVSALRLFCSAVLGRELTELPLKPPLRERRLPTVLSRDEVARLLAEVRYPKYLAALALMYSGGLRVGEVIRLRPGDLDRERGLIRVRQAKGRKDRYTLLSESALSLVDAYLDGADPGTWLFPGSQVGTHMSERTLQKATVEAGNAAGIPKTVTSHVLRHCFATHLLEAGTDVRLIQALLGHANVRSTEIYTHVSTRHLSSIRSPFDLPPPDGESPQ
jgi:site-specific recombinase XerD